MAPRPYIPVTRSHPFRLLLTSFNQERNQMKLWLGSRIHFNCVRCWLNHIPSQGTKVPFLHFNPHPMPGLLEGRLPSYLAHWKKENIYLASATGLKENDMVCLLRLTLEGYAVLRQPCIARPRWGGAGRKGCFHHPPWVFWVLHTPGANNGQHWLYDPTAGFQR